MSQELEMAKNVLAWTMSRPNAEEIEEALNEYRQMCAVCATMGISTKKLPQVMSWLANGVIANYADWIEAKLLDSVVEKGTQDVSSG